MISRSRIIRMKRNFVRCLIDFVDTDLMGILFPVRKNANGVFIMAYVINLRYKIYKSNIVFIIFNS